MAMGMKIGGVENRNGNGHCYTGGNENKKPTCTVFTLDCFHEPQNIGNGCKQYCEPAGEVNRPCEQPGTITVFKQWKGREFGVQNPDNLPRQPSPAPSRQTLTTTRAVPNTRATRV